MNSKDKIRSYLDKNGFYFASNQSQLESAKGCDFLQPLKNILTQADDYTFVRAELKSQVELPICMRRRYHLDLVNPEKDDILEVCLKKEDGEEIYLLGKGHFSSPGTKRFEFVALGTNSVIFVDKKNICRVFKSVEFLINS